MKSHPISVGAVVQGNCTNCRKSTTQRITEIPKRGSIKARCKRCQHQNSFTPEETHRNPEDALTPTAGDEDRDRWENLRQAYRKAIHPDHVPAGSHRSGGIINHPVFGLGFVQRRIGPLTIEVLFEQGLQIIIFRRGDG